MNEVAVVARASRTGGLPRHPAPSGRRVLWRALSTAPRTVLVLLLGLQYLPWIASPPVTDSLEANRLQAAREMLHSGDWIVPTLGGTIYLAKPPLHPWTMALVSAIPGEVSALSGRAVSALAALGTCLLVYGWGRRELGRRAGIAAALLLGTSVAFATKASRAELEVELVLFSTAALVAAWQACVETRPSRVFLARLLCGLSIGAALLVKGPPPLLVFAGAVSAAAWPRFPWRRKLLLAALAAVPIGVGCALLWVIPLCQRLGFESAWNSFQSEFLERIARAGRTNAEPFWFYLPALLVGLLPATLFAPGLALLGFRRSAETGGSDRFRGLRMYLLSWAVVPVLAFSISAGKETRYLLPVLPAWAMLLAWGWVRARARGRFVGWHAGLARVARLATWILPVGWLIAGWILYPEDRAAVIASAALGLVARVAFAAGARSRRPAIALASVALAVLAGRLAWAGTSVAVDRRAAPLHEIGRAVEARVPPGEPFVFLGKYKSYWGFAVRRRCIAVQDWGALAAAMGQPRVRRSSCVLLPEASLPAEVGSAAVLDRWVVEGSPYVLVDWEP